MTKREKGSHKKLEEEAQNEKLTEMLIMKLEQRHLREKQKNSRKRAKENTGPGHGLNEDWGGHLRTRAWLPLFSKM